MSIVPVEAGESLEPKSSRPIWTRLHLKKKKKKMFLKSVPRSVFDEMTRR
jgi:hypothetical protein